MCSAAGIGAASFAQNLFSSNAQATAQYQNEMVAYNQAKANWEIDKRQAQDRQRLLDTNAILQLQQALAGQQEINEAAAEQKSEIARELLRAKEQAKLSAGEANISGNVVDRIMSDIGFTEQSKIAAVEASRENQVGQIQSEKFNIEQSRRQAPIYAAIGPPPEDNTNNFASFLSAAISGFSAYAGAYKPTSTACGTAPRTTTTRCGSR